MSCGDINIPSVSGRYFDYASPVPIANTDAGLDPRFNGSPGRLGKLFKDRRWVEVEPLAPPQFNTLNNTGTTIDRIFVNTAPCFLKQCKWAASILDNPKKLYTSGISDHGMVQAKACFFSATAPGEGVIPPPYLQCGTFQRFVQQLVYETRIRTMTNPWEQKKNCGNDKGSCIIYEGAYARRPGGARRFHEGPDACYHCQGNLGTEYFYC